MTPEQFYSESKWPEMKDKFDKSAFKFSHYDLCQFANDYAQQELQAYRDIIKELLPFAIKAQYSTSIHNEKGREDVRKILSTIERARKLIDTV